MPCLYWNGKNEMSKINRSLAIIVGINQYQHIPSLKSAVTDAVELASVLKDIYGYEVLLLLNQRATKAELDKLVNYLKNKTIKFDDRSIQVTSCDRLLFYFAGHGFAEEAPDSEAGKPAGYFMPQDAESSHKSTWLSMHEVYEAFSSLNCHHLLMILDCCFAGRISWISQGRNAAPSGKLYRQNYDRFVKHKTEQIITSAAYDEEAQDLSRFGQRGEKNGNSPFAHLLLKVLRGNSHGGKDKGIEAIVEDGVITTQELFTYLQNKLGAIAVGQTPGLSQPRKYDPKTGEYVYLKGEYIFPLPQFNPEHLPKYKLDKNTNPYKGLASFNIEDSHLFFGRTVLSQQLADVVKEQPLTIVLGVSGSGKSSLAKAGLIPTLKAESNEQQWQILDPMRPGGSPFKELNKILTRSTSDSSIIGLPLTKKTEIIAERFGYWIERNSKSKLLLLIDQSEELLTLSRDRQTAKDFLTLLVELLNRYSQLRIVLTLRSDFESQIKDVVKETYWQEWQQGRFTVTPMNREELRQVIEEPAAQRTLFFESPQLVARLIDETIDRIGVLPLLSFTLSELYLRYLQGEENGVRDNRTITKADYSDLGGVEGSLAQAATRTYRELRERKIDSTTINNVMLRMVSLNGSEITRRRVLKSELNYPELIQQDVESIINRFVDARLFTTGRDAEGQKYVEPVHDALITRWQKLISKPETQENLLLQRRLTPAASEWDRRDRERKLGFRTNIKDIISDLIWASKRSPKQSETSQENPKQYLWNASPYLDVLDRVLRSDDNNWLNQIETVFVRRSVGRKKFNTRIRRFVAVSIVILSGVLTVWALRETKKALLGTINTHKESAETNLRSGSDLEATIDILKARQELESFLLKGSQPEAELAAVKGTMHNVLYQIKERNRLQTNRGSIYYMALSSDNKLLAFSYEDTLTLWNLEKNRQVDAITTKQNFIYTLAFNPNNNQVATGGSDGTVKLWNIDENDENQNIQEPEGNNAVVYRHPEGREVNSIVFLAEDKLAIAGQRKEIVIRDISSPEMKSVPTEQEYIANLAFDREKKLLAISAGNGSVELCKVEFKKDEDENKSCSVLNSPSIDTEDVKAIAFTNDGKLAFGIEQGQIAVFEVGENSNDNSPFLAGESPKISTDGDDGDIVYSMAWFSDGNLATIGADDIIRLRNKSGEEIKPIQPLESSVPNNAIALSPDGKLLAVGREDGTVKLWDAVSGKQTKRILTEQGSISSLVFSPDGKRLVTAGIEEEEVKFWNLDRTYFLSGEADYSVSTGQGGIVSVIFNPINSKQLGTIGDDGIYKLWDVSEEVNQTEKEIRRIETDIQDVKSAVFTPNGEVLITLSDDGEVQSWENPQDAESLLTGLDDEDKITNFALSPDGTRMALGYKNGTVRQWDDSPEPQLLLETQQGSIDALAYSPDGKKLATVGEDNTVRLWATSGKAPTELTLEKEVDSMVFANSNLLTVGKDGTAQLWNSSNTNKIKEIQNLQDVEYKVAFSADKELLAFAGSNGIVQLLDSLGNQIDEKQTNQSTVESVKFSPDGKRLVTISKNQKQENTVELWNIKKKDGKFSLDMVEIWNIRQKNGKSTIQKQDDNSEGKIDLKNLFSDDWGKLASTAFNSENDLLVAFGNNRQAEVYNISKDSLESFPVRQSKISSVALSKDGELLATAGEDGSLTLGNTSGTHFDQILTLQGKIRSVLFSTDNKLLATIGEKEGKTTVKVWRILENKWLRSFKQLPEEEGISDVAFSSDGKLLGTLDKDNVVSFWQIGDEEDLFKEICSLIGNYLQNGSNLEDSDRALCGRESTSEQAIAQDSNTNISTETRKELLSAIAGDFYDRGQEEVSENIVNKTPLNVDDYINKGVAYFRLRNKYPEKNYIQEAIYHYTQALEMEPTDPQAVQALVNRGIAYSTLGNQNEAIDDYDEVVNKLNPNYADAYIGRGIAYSALPEPDLERAIEDYKRASDRSDNINSDANAYYALGFTYALQEETKLKAIEAYEKAEKLYSQLGKDDYRQSAQDRIKDLEEN